MPCKLPRYAIKGWRHVALSKVYRKQLKNRIRGFMFNLNSNFNILFALFLLPLISRLMAPQWLSLLKAKVSMVLKSDD